MFDSWNNNHKILLSCCFQNVVCLFNAVNITGDIEIFVQISILLNKTEIFKIWTKFFTFPVINWQHKKGKPHFGNGRTRGILWSLSLRNLLLNLGLQINVSNYFKDQRRPSTRLARLLSCFVGHPVYNCNLNCKK